MLISVLVVLAIVFTVWAVAEDWCGLISALFSVLSISACITGIIALIVVNTGVSGRIAQCHERYESLTYQLESGMYENDNDVGKKELMSEIREWNEDLAYNKAMQRDFWVGTFIPNIYDHFEFIDVRVIESF